MPSPNEAHPEGDEQRGGVLDHESDPDRNPGDGLEVEPLDADESDDTEHREGNPLTAPQTKGGSLADGEPHEEDHGGSGDPQLRKSKRIHARVQDQARHGPVDPPQNRGGDDHDRPRKRRAGPHRR